MAEDLFELERFHLPYGFKLISGGQSGADRAALDWAIERKIECGGWCPKGRKTEDGILGLRYPLKEATSSSYLQRTEWNVRDSDATLIFTLTPDLDGGSKRTADFCQKRGKPFKHIYPGVKPESIVEFLERIRPRILNVAGKRESSAPGIGAWVCGYLDGVTFPSASS